MKSYWLTYWIVTKVNMVTKVTEVLLDGMITYVTIFNFVANDIINFTDTMGALITIVIDETCLPYSRESVSFCWYFLSYFCWEEKVALFTKKNFWIKAFLIDILIKLHMFIQLVYFLNFSRIYTKT